MRRTLQEVGPSEPSHASSDSRIHASPSSIIRWIAFNHLQIFAEPLQLPSNPEATSDQVTDSSRFQPLALNPTVQTGAKFLQCSELGMLWREKLTAVMSVPSVDLPDRLFLLVYLGFFLSLLGYSRPHGENVLQSIKNQGRRSPVPPPC